MPNICPQAATNAADRGAGREDLGKWIAAFSGKPYYRGDFDACPNFAEYDYDAAELDVPRVFRSMHAPALGCVFRN